MEEEPPIPERPLVPGEEPTISKRGEKKKGKVTAKFSFPFIQQCMSLIAAAALVWALSSIYFGIMFLFPMDVLTIVIIVVAIVGSWVGVIVTARKSNQLLAAVLLFVVSALSGLAGAIHPLMIRVPIGCLIIIGLWWVWGYWIHVAEHHSLAVAGIILLGLLVDLAIYWLVLTVIFQEEWLFWVLYLLEAIFVFSAMVYQSFHVKEEDIAENRMWVVFMAILSMFIAFMILAVVAVIIALAAAGGDFAFDLGDLSFSGSGSKKKKQVKLPGPGAASIP